MTGIYLHMQWPLASPLASVSQHFHVEFGRKMRENCIACQCSVEIAPRANVWSMPRKALPRNSQTGPVSSPLALDLETKTSAIKLAKSEELRFYRIGSATV
jgi:hypothetical protein